MPMGTAFCPSTTVALEMLGPIPTETEPFAVSLTEIRVICAISRST